MSIDNRPRVSDFKAWGNLIKRWAKGEQAKPTSLADFLDQCTAADVGMTMPDHVVDLVVIQKEADTFVLRLPPASEIVESELALETLNAYPIPPFYNERYHALPDVPKEEMKDFHAQRIGDYSLSLCI